MITISIIDSYAYWPMVRQVFSHRIFKPCYAEAGDEKEILAGLKSSTRVLGALEAIATGARTGITPVLNLWLLSRR